MKDKKKKLRDLIDKYGFTHMVKNTGIDASELVTLTDYPINPEISYLIIIEMFSKNLLPRRYKEFNIEFSDLEDSIRWEYVGKNKGVPEIMYAYATPYWDGSDMIPVEHESYSALIDGTPKHEYNLFGNEFSAPTNFKNVEELVKWYKDNYLVVVYDYLMDKLSYCRKYIKS